MAADDTLKRIEERLTRLESALSQGAGTGTGGFNVPGGAVVDPAPWGGGGGGWGYPRWPHPITDPGPWWPRPHPVVDPAPWPTPVVDPAPWHFRPTAAPATASAAFGRIGPIGDPPPIDVSRFSVVQLEAALHSINAEKARLSSMETLITQQLERVKKGG